jgi:Leucine-rich repeat (LRR) protein
MKKLLLLLLCVPLIGVGQTMIPDANFEQALINLGYDTGTPNGSVPTSSIDTVTYLDVSYQNITDLTGIEGFTSLTELYCYNNQLTTLDVSNNTALTGLYCWDNQLTYLNISNTSLVTINNLSSLALFHQLTPQNSNSFELYMHNMPNLTTLFLDEDSSITLLSIKDNPLLTNITFYYTLVDDLDVINNPLLTSVGIRYSALTSLSVVNNPALQTMNCSSNQLTTLDVSNNTALTGLNCSSNQLSSLDVSQSIALEYLDCYVNQLTLLDLKNLNYFNLFINTIQNPALLCIEVSDSIVATNALSSGIDSWSYFSEDCNYVSGIEELYNNRELLKVTDILGRDSDRKRNTPLFYIYNDGTVEKKIIIE